MKITRINHAAVNIHGKVDEARAFEDYLVPNIRRRYAKPR